MKKTFKIIWNILQVLIIIYVIIVTSLLFFENKYGFSQFGKYIIHNVSKLDEENSSNIKEGDLIIIKNNPKLKVGDNVYYYAVSNEKYIVSSSKVVEVNKDRDNYLYKVLKNDTTIISSTRVMGNKVYKFSHLGKMLSVVESRTGFIFFVLLPIMIVFVYQVYQFLVILRYEKAVKLVEDDELNIDDEIL